jgi:hypothetical protein
MRIINVCSRRNISEIKLKRTDTTLDLSQKAKLQNVLAKMFKCRGWFGITDRAEKEKKEKSEASRWWRSNLCLARRASDAKTQ